MRFPVVLAALLSVRSLPAAADQVQIISGVNSLYPGPAGTLYALASGTIDTTPGAYLSQPQAVYYPPSLRRFDPATGRILYATYLDIIPSGLFVDAGGAAYITGRPATQNSQITPGAYDRGFKGGEELVVAKLNSSGSAMEWVTMLGGSGPYGGSIPGVAAGPDGSVYVTGTTCSADFPTTPDALQPAAPPRQYRPGCNAFFSQLSTDGSQLVYSTYLGGSLDSSSLAIALGDDGKVRLGGQTSAADFPVTPGTFTTPGGTSYSRTFLATWIPGARRFESVAAFDGSPWRFAWSGSRVAIVASNAGDITTYAGPFPPGGYQILLLLDQDTWQPVYSVSAPSVNSIGLSPDGSVTIIGLGTHAIVPSPGAYMLSSQSGQFIANVDPTGKRLTAATYFESALYPNAAAFTPGTTFIAASTYSDVDQLDISPPFPIVAKPPSGNCATIYALPNVIQQCGTGLQPPTFSIYWDACDPNLATAEVRLDTPDGPWLASTATGERDYTPSKASVRLFLREPGGRVLGSDTISYEPAPRCSSVLPDPQGHLTANPNPILSCADGSSTGIRTTLSGIGNGNGIEIRVNTPSGSRLNYSPTSYASATAGDWIRDGTQFFLTDARTGEAYATERVYLLPIRSCTTPEFPAPATIRAKPNNIPCNVKTSVTLAWYSGNIHPVEIHESAPSGPVVARFDTTSGLYEAGVSKTTTYFLTGYYAGSWVTLTSDTVTATGLLCR
jgi:hypothetical protein